MEIDSVHFYVTDAIVTSNWFINYLDFQLVDSDRDADTLTIATKYKSILFVFSSPLNNYSFVARYLASHPEGICDITFRVHQLPSIINNAKSSGIKVLQSIRERSKIRYARIAGWDCLQHSLIESLSKADCYLLPNGKLKTFNLVKDKEQLHNKFTFDAIDHIVLNVSKGELKKAVSYYQSLFGLHIQQTFEIKTERSGLLSQALIDNTGKVQFNINEPTNRDSQIQDFIDRNGGSGIQHLALKSTDIIQDVAKMRGTVRSHLSEKTISFLSVPNAYYLQLKQRLKEDLINLSVDELDAIAKQKILIDWHRKKTNSLLLQIFTQPILAQPTFFLEFIERRKQARGFGEGNFKALFAAVEREQFKTK